ncbi:MAG: GNAT family N-acetyltransferase [Lachnospiraceae bacterium]|nr:GNAT family N-acetyltransferase [Lachnospiraceae bacterium]
MNDVNLRKAEPGDEALLLRWANDPATRANSFTSALISPEQHHRWFSGKLSDPCCDILIFSLKSPLENKDRTGETPAENVVEDSSEGALEGAAVPMSPSDIPAGMVRLDHRDGTALISYSVDRGFRRQGFGSLFLKTAMGYTLDKRPDTACFKGEVKPENEASKHIFRGLGFREDISEDGIFIYTYDCRR